MIIDCLAQNIFSIPASFMKWLLAGAQLRFQCLRDDHWPRWKEGRHPLQLHKSEENLIGLIFNVIQHALPSQLWQTGLKTHFCTFVLIICKIQLNLQNLIWRHCAVRIEISNLWVHKASWNANAFKSSFSKRSTFLSSLTMKHVGNMKSTNCCSPYFSLQHPVWNPTPTAIH